MGRGVMKVLILDRGFIDGPSIENCKKDYGVDVIMPSSKNMDLYKSFALADTLLQVPFYLRQRAELNGVTRPHTAASDADTHGCRSS